MQSCSNCMCLNKAKNRSGCALEALMHYLQGLSCVCLCSRYWIAKSRNNIGRCIDIWTTRRKLTSDPRARSVLLKMRFLLLPLFFTASICFQLQIPSCNNPENCFPTHQRNVSYPLHYCKKFQPEYGRVHFWKTILCTNADSQTIIGLDRGVVERC